jgi:hypothetical protein
MFRLKQLGSGTRVRILLVLVDTKVGKPPLFFIQLFIFFESRLLNSRILNSDAVPAVGLRTRIPSLRIRIRIKASK